ncbi:peroxidase family protein [Tabrizicola sp.]|uniref:peroxidase family protein n=1 Tax=Tabrizicola sp. TaxID=2005166 RepID=UPI001A370DD4|nr:peroxidase family protein [Tabrizicola sp.]MBL9074839.1 hypothetical protein [Tabrizicola sp.]
MPITSAHDLIDGIATRAVPLARSRYCYLFPHLAEDLLAGCVTGTTPRQTCDRLRAFELASRVPLSRMPVLQMRLPAAYTYFGQFMNHDISAPSGDVVTQAGWTPVAGVIGTADPPGLDRNRRAAPEIILENLANEHEAPLTLASLYGEGPDSADPEVRALYEADGKRFRLGQTRREAEQVFTDLLIDPGRVVHATGAPDLPRAGRKALIADRRNDENLILSQLHLALMLLHNKAVAALEPQVPDPARCFAEARGLVTRHYHWLILHDYLPRLLSPSVLSGSLARRPVRLAEAGRVPLEFTTAAFRFGHSMVGSAYDFNANFGLNGRISDEGATLEDLFAFTSRNNMQSDVTATLALPDHWVIDWARMTRLLPPRPGGTPRPFGSAERIDLTFARDMLNLVGSSDVAVHGSILFRNLMRGFHRRIPLGQRLAVEYGVTPLTEEELRAALPEDGPPGAGEPGLRETAAALGFLRETPAWLYFLCESRLRENGERVGATASHIIADTITGLIRLNPDSLLNRDGRRWHPRDSMLGGSEGAGLTTLRKLLLFAVRGADGPG